MFESGWNAEEGIGFVEKCSHTDAHISLRPVYGPSSPKCNLRNHGLLNTRYLG